MDSYTCELCHETFEKGWTDEEANAEAQELFGTPQASEHPKDMAIVCDDCFHKLMSVN